ncbi:hypothetical protein [Candidiatus Paracoxiella cheracis]|uniref:hypothetical protein n=1 Tax=Candidiatus Paracoxiella cheracis TaxID=3405120 RepID=UPI003BF60987
MKKTTINAIAQFTKNEAISLKGILPPSVRISNNPKTIETRNLSNSLIMSTRDLKNSFIVSKGASNGIGVCLGNYYARGLGLPPVCWEGVKR